MKPADIVQQWIAEHFDLTKFTVTDFPLFPWGRLIDDGKDTMIRG